MPRGCGGPVSYGVDNVSPKQGLIERDLWLSEYIGRFLASISDMYSHANTRVDVPEYAVMPICMHELHMIKNIGTTIILSPVHLL